jgi:hypothetical protein
MSETGRRRGRQNENFFSVKRFALALQGHGQEKDVGIEFQGSTGNFIKTVVNKLWYAHAKSLS